MNLRDFYHILIGFTVMYIIGSLTDFSEYTQISKVIGVTIASIVIGLSIGFFWEWVQSLINPENFDENDIVRTSIGTAIGGIASVLFPDATWLMITLSIVSIGLILKDLIKK